MTKENTPSKAGPRPRMASQWHSCRPLRGDTSRRRSNSVRQYGRSFASVRSSAPGTALNSAAVLAPTVEGRAHCGCEHMGVTDEEIFQRLPFPYEGGRFPSHLGALLQRTVLAGELPAREVVHTSDGSWVIGDGVNDPNLPGASEIAHIAHAVALNSSIAVLATIPPGHIAERARPGEPWEIKIHMGSDDD